MTAQLSQSTIEDLTSRLDADGYVVVPNVLTPSEVDEAVSRLWAASEESLRRGGKTHIEHLDPNASNVRVFNLVDLDPLFAELLAHPTADAVVSAALGDDYVVSSFTANIARPGSGSMFVHSDQSLIAPEPWREAWALNVIWCLTDVRFDNGGTLFLPGSHRFETRAELPDDLESRLVAFEAPAGSIIVMEGRLWHTSGSNITADEDRPMLFAYYTRAFVRPQVNFAVSLRPEVQATFSPLMRYRLGLDVALNVGPPSVAGPHAVPLPDSTPAGAAAER